MEFYRALVRWAARTPDAPPILFASREPLPQLIDYLHKNGLGGQNAVNLGAETRFRHVPVPALLLLDAEHVVLRLWEGRINTEDRKRVLETLAGVVSGD